MTLRSVLSIALPLMLVGIGVTFLHAARRPPVAATASRLAARASAALSKDAAVHQSASLIRTPAAAPPSPQAPSRTRETSNRPHVWTNADLSHVSHQSPRRDPHLDEIVAHLAATQYRWYPPVGSYDGPTNIPSPHRPSWQNDAWNWPTQADRAERGGPFSIDEDFPPYGLPLFGCWGCGARVTARPFVRFPTRRVAPRSSARIHRR